MPSFEIAEVVLLQCNLVDNQYKLKYEFYILLRPINIMVI